MNNVIELTTSELKSLNGGAPAKGSTFIYDSFYTAFYWIRKSEILTWEFWEEWGYAIL